MNKMRCPSCRGAKKVPKLGGVIGDCNTCGGKGEINEIDKPMPCVSEPVSNDLAVIQAVSDAVHGSVNDADMKELFAKLPAEEDIKVDPKRTIYRRKKA